MGREFLIDCAGVQWRGQALASLQLSSIEGFVVFITSNVAQVVRRSPTPIIPLCNVHLLLKCNTGQHPHKGPRQAIPRRQQPLAATVPLMHEAVRCSHASGIEIPAGVHPSDLLASGAGQKSPSEHPDHQSVSQRFYRSPSCMHRRIQVNMRMPMPPSEYGIYRCRAGRGQALDVNELLEILPVWTGAEHAATATKARLAGRRLRLHQDSASHHPRTSQCVGMPCERTFHP